MNFYKISQFGSTVFTITVAIFTLVAFHKLGMLSNKILLTVIIISGLCRIAYLMNNFYMVLKSNNTVYASKLIEKLMKK